MQIILMEKVVNLGVLGDIVKVKDGYARNFLIPQGIAKRANKVNVAELENRRAELEAAAQAKLLESQSQGEKLSGLVVSISQKAGVDGRLFGSVTNADIADALKAQGFDVQKSMVRMPLGPIKIIGESTLEVALHTDVVSAITVVVSAETAS